MTNKERYSEWVSQQEYVPICMNPWWLDAVCAGKEWDVLFAEDEEGNILGAMPYLLCKRAWFKFITMPQMSQTGGIWVTAEITADKWKRNAYKVRTTTKRGFPNSCYAVRNRNAC